MYSNHGEGKKAWTKAAANILNNKDASNEEKVVAMLEMLENDAMTRKAANRDFGRYGDIIEVNVCAYLRGENMRARDVHVKAMKNTDLRYKGYNVEVGSNGKTFASRNAERYEPSYMETGWDIDDVLNKKIRFFIYGVRAQQIVENASYPWDMYVFTREQLAEFFENSGLHGLTTNLSAKKYGYALTVNYNESYAKRFDRWVASHGIPTLEEFKNAMEGMKK